MAQASRAADAQTRPPVSRLHRAGHLVFLMAVVGFCLWLLADAYEASPTLTNLGAIVPGAVLAALFGLVILAQEMRAWTLGEPAEAEGEAALLGPARLTEDGRSTGPKPYVLMALVSGFVMLVPVVGFDIATFAFIAAGLVALGERRPLFIVILSAAVTFVLMLMLRMLFTPPETMIGL